MLNRGYPVGDESGAAAWSLWITGTDPGRTKGSLMNGFSSGYFANMVFDKADWGPGDGTVARDWSASQKTGGALDAANTDSAPSRPPAASSSSITAGATQRSRRQAQWIILRRWPTAWAVWTRSSLSTVCSWRLA
jgi:hypothetical protein